MGSLLYLSLLSLNSPSHTEWCRPLFAGCQGQALNNTRKTQVGSPRANESLFSLLFQKAVGIQCKQEQDRLVNAPSEFDTDVAAVTGQSQSETCTGYIWSS